MRDSGTAKDYFSAASSKSHDYAAGSERPAAPCTGAAQGMSTVRLVFLCKVAQGSSFECRQDRLEPGQVQGLVKPNGAHDSIHGLTVASGGALNFDELVVYRNDAAVPSYLIAYQMP